MTTALFRNRKPATELQFSVVLAQDMNVIMYAEFASEIEINGLKEMITDY